MECFLRPGRRQIRRRETNKNVTTFSLGKLELTTKTFLWVTLCLLQVFISLKLQLYIRCEELWKENKIILCRHNFVVIFQSFQNWYKMHFICHQIHLLSYYFSRKNSRIWWWIIPQEGFEYQISNLVEINQIEKIYWKRSK